MYQPLDAAAKASKLWQGYARSISSFETASSSETASSESKSFELVPFEPIEAETIAFVAAASTQSAAQYIKAVDEETDRETGETALEADLATVCESEARSAMPAINVSQPHWNRLAIGSLLLSLPLGVSAAAYHVIATPPQPNCNQPQQLRADLAELQCLRRAMQSENKADIIRSLQALQNWSQESPVYELSQRLLEDWSVVALSLAHQEFEAGQWESAARLAAAVPAQIELGSQAQERLTIWQKIQKQGEVAYERAITALEQQDWKAARVHAQTLANIGNDYWRQQGIHKLPEQIKQAQQAQQPESDAVQLSSQPNPSVPMPSSGAQHQSLPPAPPVPRRSRFSMPVLISLEPLTVVDPKPGQPDFSAAA